MIGNNNSYSSAYPFPSALLAVLRDLLLLLMLRADWEPSSAEGGARSSAGAGGGGAGLASKLTVRMGRFRFSGRDISSARGTKTLEEANACKGK